MEFHSAILGDFKLAVVNIRTLEFTATNAAKLIVGDVLAVQYSFSQVELAMDSIHSIRISETIPLRQFFTENGRSSKPPFHIAYIVLAGTVGNQQLPQIKRNPWELISMSICPSK